MIASINDKLKMEIKHDNVNLIITMVDNRHRSYKFNLETIVDKERFRQDVNILELGMIIARVYGVDFIYIIRPIRDYVMISDL